MFEAKQEPTPGAPPMGADRLFLRPPTRDRKRKRRLIDDLEPEIRRRFKQVVNRYPAELKRQIRELADKQGISAYDVAFHAITLYFLRTPRPELIEKLKTVFPDAPADEIERGLDSLQRQYDGGARPGMQSCLLSRSVDNAVARSPLLACSPKTSSGAQFRSDGRLAVAGSLRHPPPTRISPFL